MSVKTLYPHQALQCVTRPHVYLAILKSPKPLDMFYLGINVPSAVTQLPFALAKIVRLLHRKDHLGGRRCDGPRYRQIFETFKWYPD